MVKSARRSKTVRRQRRNARVVEQQKFGGAPHSMVFSRSGVGPLAKTLSMDLRQVFEPFTATKLKLKKSNVLKDFINIAGPMNVSHLLYITHPNSSLKQKKYDSADSFAQASNHDGHPYLHFIRSPHGPSLTFRIDEYCLTKDVTNIVHRIFGTNQFASPPLLAMTGFADQKSAQAPLPHLRLMVDMFQNMLPALNVRKLKLSTVKRVLLLSRECDKASGDDLIYLRHYHIRTENSELSKPLKRIGMGGAQMRKKMSSNCAIQNPGVGPGGRGHSTGVPNLSKYCSIEDYLVKAGLLTDSGLSELDTEQREVELPSFPNEESKCGKTVGAENGLPHLTSKKATIKMVEIGPRLTLQLVKVEEGLNDGSVLYHKFHKRSQTQIDALAERKRLEREAKQSQGQLDEERRKANELARETNKQKHKEKCLAGMNAKEPDLETQKTLASILKKPKAKRAN